MTFDIVVRGGYVADGAGNPLVRTDVGVCGDRIAALGRLPDGRTTVDASGRVVAPGFIDAHNHVDHGILRCPEARNFILQGFTTSVCGNCGLSLTPLSDEHREALARYMGPFVGAAPEYDWGWSDFASFARRIEAAHPAQNLAILTGHGTLRAAVMGFEDRPPRERELDRMRELLEREFDQGACGLSFGLAYPPGSYAGREEIAALLSVAARRGRRCAFHMASESTTVTECVDELLDLARETGAAVEVSHHKAIGRANRGKIFETLRTMERARAEGTDVLCDAYPYVAGSTTILSLLPTWAAEGGVEALLARLRDGTQRSRIAEAILRNDVPGDNLMLLQGWGRVLIGSCPADPACEGRNLADILNRQTMDAESIGAFMDWLLRIGGTALMVLLDEQSEDDLMHVLGHPLTALGSDAWAVRSGEGCPHPRAYGTTARFLGRIARDRGLLRPEEAVRRMTSAPAQRYGIAGRGLIAEGLLADLVVFDPDAFLDRGDFLDPHHPPSGLSTVIVNGEAAVLNGEQTTRRAGRVLRASA